MGDIVTGHGQDGDLCDRSLLSLDPSRTLVELCEVGVHVTGVSTPSGHLFSCCSDLTECLTVVGDIGHDDQNLHSELERHVLRRCKSKTGCDDTLCCRIVCQVQEDHSVLQRTGPLELLHEHLLLFVGDSHCDEHDSELLVLSAYLRLPCDLKSKVVVGKTRS